jgi:hypothetical protein
MPDRQWLGLRSGSMSPHKAVSTDAGMGGNGNKKIYAIHFRDSPRGREVYRELLELKEKYRAPWARVLAMLLEAYHKLESGKIEELAPSILERPFNIYVRKSGHTYTMISNQLTKHFIQEPYWMQKYIGKRLLYIIIVRDILYRVIGRVFEQRDEGNTRRYILADIRVLGTYVPSKEALDSIKNMIWAKVNELCNRDHTCGGVDVEPELNRIYYVVR